MNLLGAAASYKIGTDDAYSVASLKEQAQFFAHLVKTSYLNQKWLNFSNSPIILKPMTCLCYLAGKKQSIDFSSRVISSKDSLKKSNQLISAQELQATKIHSRKAIN
jgi:hypothetical protein